MVKNKKMIIAGPCAIETKSGLLSIVKSIHNHVHVIRAGVWKARTLPKNYSGKGLEALKWIEYLQHKYNIPFAVEVGTKTHVELALKYNIKILWIGARTTGNPFSVQEIADSLSNSDVEIWIKNPIFSNIDLWFGAIKRFQLNQLTKIKVIHRGFYEEKEEKYRNSPRWDLVHKFRKKYPAIPIICDPSHIAGKRNLIYKTAKKALEENFDGLMIEVHHNPNNALSDKDQQLTPLDFKKLLTQLKLK